MIEDQDSNIAPDNVAEMPSSNSGSQDPASRIAALEAEVQELKDKWLRSEAELVNLRGRTKRQIEDGRAYAVQKFAKDVVEAAENLRRGIEALPPRAYGEPELLTKIRDGFEGIERSFVALLERNGILRIDPTGSNFNPDYHQAMAEQSTFNSPPGTVLQAWSQTWMLNGRLLRPAMVVVAKAPDPNSPLPETV